MTAPYYEDDLVTLYHGDCREATDWLSADVMVTDPPYGIDFQSHKSLHDRGGHSRIANDGDTTLRDHAIRSWRHHASGGEVGMGNWRPALVFGSWKMPKPVGTHTVLIWDKGPASGMGNLSIPWKPNTEEIYVLGKGFTGRRDSSVLSDTQVSRYSMGREHPNMKPVGLLTALISKTVGTVADPFAGSGSTLVAAKAMGRRAIGVELDERYCEAAAKRLAQDTLFPGMLVIPTCLAEAAPPNLTNALLAFPDEESA